ncbi:MAG: riboflavin synthase [Bdellovibrionaceae bacterium]|nr:riboflavin synthase [Pseudobdellovibrionaceae bacterium]MDW8189538.1 riboflavin synthase [Pseudobdellovibrionaceae bacterium]
MFTGIVELTSPVQRLEIQEHSALLEIARPKEFTDLMIGHSVAVNGICLTLERLDSHSMGFHLGYETLKILSLPSSHWENGVAQILRSPINLERPLKITDRLHGHLVTGHVDGLLKVTSWKQQETSVIVDFFFPSSHRHYFWKKGSVAINGVSLTINDICDTYLTVCLIPETLRKTNLCFLKVGDWVTFEADFLAKAIWEMNKNLQPKIKHDE